MIEAIAVILVIMWLLGMLTHTMLGGLIHILLILAVVAVVIRLITGRRPVV
ncbi:MAG: lmo0937 family membrane protein [Bacteroidota bacterium]